jgi:hypothetical protein
MSITQTTNGPYLTLYGRLRAVLLDPGYTGARAFRYDQTVAIFHTTKYICVTNQFYRK